MIANDTPKTQYPSGQEYLRDLPKSMPHLFDKSFSVKVVEVAKKYDAPEVSRLLGFVVLYHVIALKCQ
jgi:hypothetical protein